VRSPRRRGADGAGSASPDDVRRALALLLRGHEPSPGVILDRAWDVRAVNRAFAALHLAVTGATIAPYVATDGALILVDTFFTACRPHVRNFDEVGAHLSPRLRRDAVLEPRLARRFARWSTLGPDPFAAPRPLGVVPYEIGLGGEGRASRPPTAPPRCP